MTEAKAALVRSGYLLESRVQQTLTTWGYTVESSQAFLDPLTQKSREIDLLALMPLNLEPDARTDWRRLLIECVNNETPIALIDHAQEMPELGAYSVQIAGGPSEVDSPTGPVSLADFLGLDKLHHYCTRARCASQWCSFSRKSGQDTWMASHDPVQFDAFSRLAMATRFFREREPLHADLELSFFYPILVLQGTLLEAEATARSVKLRPVTHGQFALAAVEADDLLEYRIDVVTERGLPALLEMLHDEGLSIDAAIRAQESALEAALGRAAAGST